MKRVLLVLLFLLFITNTVLADLPELIIKIPSDTTHTLFGNRIEPVGDQNSDGYDDFLTFDYNNRIFNRVFLYLGGDPPDTLPILTFENCRVRFSNVGDLNGDYIDDYAIPITLPSYQVRIGLKYGGEPFNTDYDLYFGTDTLYGTGFIRSGGDINANGTNELITWDHPDYGKSLLFYELGMDSDSIADFVLRPYGYTHYSVFGGGLITGDFNGDGVTDLCANLQPRPQDTTNGMLYLYFGGSAFDTIPDMIIRRPGKYQSSYERFGNELEYLGDINGDSYDDFCVVPNAYYDSLNRIYFGGPDIDTVADIIIDDKYCERARLAGDINNDGYNDIITSVSTEFGDFGWIDIYYGGPDIDSISDFHFNASELPLSQYYFAHEVSGIGDFNGDGINDFAVASYGPGNDQEIFIFSGWDDGTDVPYDYEPTLPNGFSLHQNYPNPFNNSTSISFEIPYKEKVSLTIYNILGKEVKKLINRELSAGTYHLTWDGMDNNGQPVSSGVYFYKLSSSSFNQEMKMVLVK